MRSFGLIGFPLTHSFSQKYFTEKFQREGIDDAEYHLLPIEEISELPSLLSKHPNLAGLNVTIPHKESILPFLDELDETAQAVGAVNCIKITPNPKLETRNPKLETRNPKLETPHLKGYNTDVHGFRQSIKPFLEMHHERALILGTGGGAKAVHYVLSQIGIDCYFVSRNADGREKHFNYEDVNHYVMEAFPLIVNTTPSGMHPNIDSFPPIPYEHIGSRHFLYDLVYNPAETQFLQKGKAQGATTMNGLSMLYAQADKAWEIWNA